MTVMGLAGLAALLAVTIDHIAYDCVLKDRYSRIDAVIEPATAVSQARVYFKRADQDDFYAVDMTLQRGRFEARLPRPKGRDDVLYFLEAVEQDGTVRRSPRMSARVVGKKSDCEDDGRVAQDVEGPELRVLAPAGRGKPEGFGGVARTASLGDAAPREGGAAPRPAVAARADAPPVPSAPPSSAANAAAQATFDAPGEDYRVGPEDILRITVYGHEDLTQAIVVQADGTFAFPLIGRVTATGATPKELQNRIAAALAKGFVRNPQVTVVVQEYRSQNVFVVGEVTRPGTYPLQGRTTVVEILAKAGPTQQAGHEVVVVRPRIHVEGPLLPTETDESQAEVIRINIRDIRMGKLDQNLLLRARDTVFVSEAAKVFVSGEVRNGGAYTYTPGLTVRHAISMAGGFTPEASSGRIRVVRAGSSKEIKIRLDDPAEPGDTIVVKSKLF